MKEFELFWLRLFCFTIKNITRVTRNYDIL